MFVIYIQMPIVVCVTYITKISKLFNVEAKKVNHNLKSLNYS